MAKDRVCKGCAKEKPKTEFPLLDGGKGVMYRSRWCKECDEWYKEHNVRRKTKNSWENLVVKEFLYNAF